MKWHLRISCSLLFLALLTSGLSADLTAVIQQRLVTSDGNGTHTTNPGVSAFGLNHDGVGDFLIDLQGGNPFDARCTASLLTGTGRTFALTAAHCVTDGNGNINAIGGIVRFDTTGGAQVGTVSNIFVHDNWNGNVADGFDVALVEFQSAVDTSVPTYTLFNGDPIDRDIVLAGYGETGFGGTGTVSGSSGTKRVGLNKIEDEGVSELGGITNENTQLTYDFDSGLTANDAFDFFGFNGGPSDLGFGDDEVGLGGGDSGGPSFIDDNGVLRIAGVHSYGFRVTATPNSDVDGVLNGSWGEFSVDADVTNSVMRSWIIDTAGIPEPSSALILIVFGGSGLILARRRRR